MSSLVSLAYIILMFVIRVTSEPVDVALNKPITAELTCGIRGSETYFNHTQIPLKPDDRIESTCVNTSTHPPEHMVDGLISTWWQSTSRNILIDSGYWGNGQQGTQAAQANIDLDLQQTFEVKEILLEMGDSKRPGRIGIYKSEDGIQYTPWAYRVSEENDCNNIFEVAIRPSPQNLDDAVCQGYADDIGLAQFEEISFDFSHIVGSLSPWRNTRFLKIAFFDMAFTLGILGGRFQHFTVRTLEIMAECYCNGHQVGCEKSVDTGQYECVCGGNTQGEYCDSCLPFYNQQPFQYGIPCQACNCHDHSDVCHYDLDIANLTLSLNADGVRQGGGVCENCQHNTTGVNCEKCVEFFYRPAERVQTDVDACVRCDCEGDGIRVDTVTGLLGDCVMNQESAPPGMTPGACFCKENVEGLKCERCKRGYYNLTAENPDGCQACFCDVRGTVEGSVCEVNSTGRCPCKTFVINRQCSECMDEYYGLSTNNTDDGCLPCECDIGGAFDNKCYKPDGQCDCRSNIGTRQCTEPNKDFYYPDPHFMSAEFEKMEGSWSREKEGYFGFGYALVSANPSVTELYIVPDTDFSGQFLVLLRYMSDQAATGAVLFRENGNESGERLDLPACPTTWCYYTVDKVFDLVIGETYEVSVSAANTEIQVDRVVALPAEFNNATLLGAQSETFKQTCDVINNDMKVGTSDEAFCLSKVFSLSSRYLRGALPCDCHPLGSYTNETCAQYGGQCSCKPGVGGRRCDECLPEYYELTARGCRACECIADHKICNPNSGECDCPANTEGRQCDRCQANSWDWDSTNGCQLCNCSTIGSESLQCNLTTGVCQCKPGVNGNKCEECLDTFTGFSITGCSQCNCDPRGSEHGVCDKINRRCPCKLNTEGQYCDRCKDGTFSLAEFHEDGCLDCVCMGITNQCDSTDRKTTVVLIPISRSENGQNISVVSLVSEQNGAEGTQIDVEWDADADMLMLYTMVLGFRTYYWQIKQGFSGNLLGLFENNITFTVVHDADNPATLIEPRVVLIGKDGARFVFELDPIQPYGHTDVSLMVTDAHLVEPTVNISRQALMLALTDVQELWLPASMAAAGHEVRIGNIRYELATDSGSQSPSPGVEQCSCGPGYSGLSCETCAFGYMRDNATTHHYLGQCITCECNNHADFCNPDTMECQNCVHNTTGFRCHLCEDGLYGDPTQGTPTDCSLCPCYAPRVIDSICQLVSGAPQCSNCQEGYSGALCDQCDQFYFGDPHILDTGTCERCDCNNNTGQCDSVTGHCLDCGFNTTGLHCERCADGWFGNASSQACQPCDCDATGSIQLICNYTTGQCECQAGVGERTCSSCIEDYFGLDNASFTGCAACECNEHGSAITQCDELGVCTCAENALGKKCDQCEQGHWGLPARQCQECDCSPIGSIDPLDPCEVVSGQCECKTGVAGRQCDVCQRLYVEFSEDGCKKCDRCQYALGNDTLNLKNLWQDYWNTTTEVRDVQSLDPTLQDLSTELNQTLASLGVSEDRLDELKDSVDTLAGQEADYNRTVDQLMTDVSNTARQTERLENESIAELSRLRSFQGQADQAWNNILTQNNSAQQKITELEANNASAQGLLDLGTLTYSDLNTTFDLELASVSAELALAQNVSAEAGAVSQKVEQQANLTSELELQSRVAESNLDKLNDEIVNVYNKEIDEIETLADSVAEKFDLNQANKEYTENLLAETKSTLALTEAIVSRNDDTFEEAKQLFQDCVTIIEGKAGDEELPVTTSVDMTGVIGWMQSFGSLQTSITDTKTSLQTYQTRVSTAKGKAEDLTIQSQVLQAEYQRVEDQGKRAVDALDNYKEVVSKLNESLQTALEANKTMQEANLALRDVSAEELTAEAAQSKADNQQLKDEAEQTKGRPDELNPRLGAANASLLIAEDRWQDLDQNLGEFYQKVDNLTDLATDPGVDPDLGDSNRLSIQVANDADSLRGDYESLQPKIAEQSDVVAVIQGTANNASLLLTQVSRDLTDFQDQLETDVQRPLDLLNQDLAQTNVTRSRLDDKMAALEAKLARARQKLLSLEQPVNYGIDDFSVMDNPDADKQNMLYNEVQLDFNYALRAQGVLFFVQNPSTDEKVLLQIENEHVVYEYSNGDVTMREESPARLCVGCWFRVTATRYNLDGQLTVQRLSTGGVAVNHIMGSSSTDGTLTLTSQLYIGGLPPGFNTTKVYEDGIEFVGCLYQVKFNGQKIPLWDTVLEPDSTSQCCLKPPNTQTPDTIDSVNVNGFGYLQLDPTSFTVVDQSHVSLEFRTFSPSAALLTVDKVGTRAKYQVVVEDGRVNFEIWPEVGNVLRVTSIRSSYNDGEWYKVTVRHNSTYIFLAVQAVNQTIPTPVAITSRSDVPIDRLPLTDASPTLGGLNPNTTTALERETPNFAGCLQNFEHNTLESLTLTPRLLDDSTVTGKQGVNLHQCYEEVVNGLGFASFSSYAKLEDMPSSISTIDFTFQTYQPHGMLLYAELSYTLSSFLYVTLYHGDIFVLFNQGSGLRGPLRSRGLYLADGQSHQVSLNFKSRNTPQLAVNGATHYGALTMSPNMNLRNRHLYAGGIPSSVTLTSNSLPVTQSLIGGISDLQINNKGVNYFNSDILRASNQKDVYLSGLPAPETSAPPLPYTTTAAPPTTPAPTCVPPLEFVTTDSGVRFGDTTISYIAFEAEDDIFKNAFTLDVEFRTVSPDGLIMYIAQTPASNPRFYFAAFLMDGYVMLSMQSDTIFSGQDNSKTKLLKSKKQYDDSKWWELSALRINDFMAVIIQDETNENKDYKNNQASSSNPSNLEIETKVYIGGVPESFVGLPFTSADDIPIGKKSFRGCIRKVSVGTHNNRLVNFDLGNPVEAFGTAKCFESIQPGIFMDGAKSYARVMEDSSEVFSITEGFRMSLTFKGSERNGTLMSAYKSRSTFVLLDIFEGKINTIVGNAASSSDPFIVFLQNTNSDYLVCDGRFHTLIFQIKNQRVVLTLDSNAEEAYDFPNSGYSFPFLTDMEIFVGGMKDYGVSIPTEASKESFKGCMKDVTLDTKVYDLVESEDQLGLMSGCPG